MSLQGVFKDIQVPDILRDEFLRNFHLDPTLETHPYSSCPPSNFMESWRTWRFLMNLELVSNIREHPWEATSRSNIRNPVKTPPVLQVSYWNLGGQWVSWWTWRCCQVIGMLLPKVCESFIKFQHRKSFETQPVHQVSSWSLGGHGGSWHPSCGVKRSMLVPRMFGENFMKIGALKGRQDSTCPPSILLESWRTWRFLIPLLVVSKDPTWSLECFVKVSWRLVH